MIVSAHLTIKRATVEDYQLIADLGARTFYETWRPVNTEEDMQEYIAKAFDPKQIKEDLSNEKVNTFFVAFDNEEAVGYAKLRRDRTYPEFEGSTAIELERIYVDKKWQDKYAGRALMDECLKLAKAENFDWFWLGVYIENHKAINFYKKYGFTIFGEKAFQLGDAVDNDYLMKLKL
jgi:ribosomal protein S18 acetylase RimI-like enzyme